MRLRYDSPLYLSDSQWAVVGCRVPELGPGLDLGFYAPPLILIDEAAEDRPTLDPLLGEVRDRVIGPGRAELTAAMGPPPVVVALVLARSVRRCRSPKISIRSVISVRAVSTNRSA